MAATSVNRSQTLLAYLMKPAFSVQIDTFYHSQWNNLHSENKVSVAIYWQTSNTY